MAQKDDIPSRPYFVEVTGVAGAGKSTLTRAVCEHDPESRRAEFIHTRIPGHLLQLIRALPRSALILMRARSPRLTWPEFKLLVYVMRWQPFLERDPEYRGRVVLLDQGPLYALVRLRAQKPELWTGSSAERWWGEMLAGWLRTLDLIVWLDASDRVLWDRINGRDQAHSTKGRSIDDGMRFLDLYRRAFEEILARAQHEGRPEVLRFDTGAASAEWVATELASALAAHRPPLSTARGVRDVGR